MLCELALHGRFAMIPEYLFMRRRHLQSASFRDRSTRKITLVYDPQKAGKLFFTYLLNAGGFLAAIRRGGLPWKERLRCYKYLSIWLWRNKGDLYQECVELGAMSLKRLLSQSNVDRLKVLRKRLSRQYPKAEQNPSGFELCRAADAGGEYASAGAWERV